jgi:Zn-dependent protease
MPINVVLVVETFAAFIVAICIHECGHAAMAVLLGDGLAAGDGRLSLNPARHMAPIGTLVAGVLSFAPSYVGIGWGRPVRYDSTHLRVGPNFGTILIAIAGPAVNAIVGLGLAAGLRFIPGYDLASVTTDSVTGPCALAAQAHYGQELERCLASVQPAYVLRLEQFAIILAVTCVAIALVNIIPLHPLDGYKVLYALLPSPQAVALRRYEPYMEAIVLLLFFVVPFLFQLIGLDVNPAGYFAALAHRAVYSLAGPGIALAQAL